MIQLIFKHYIAEFALDTMFRTLQHNFASEPAPSRLEQLVKDLGTYENVYVDAEEYKLLEEFMVEFDVVYFEGDNALIYDCST